MDIAVVILNWNGKALLEKCLPSVVAYSKNATIYVADNASTDDSVEFLKEKFPEIKIIQNKTNGGYAKGYNDALKSVNESIYILLNSDVEVTQNWLNPIEEVFLNDTSTAAIQPKILDYYKRNTFEYAGAAGGFLDTFAYPFCRGRIFSTLEVDTNQYNDTTSIFWASGACLCIKKEVFWEANGFDEDLFAHQEEIDLCWRIQKNNHQIKYVGSSTVYHMGGATLTKANPKKTYYNFRNSLLILLKNNTSASVFPIIFGRLLLDGLAGIQFLTQGKPKHTIAILKAHFGFYKLANKYLQKRKENKTQIPYAKTKSIVWSYFIRKKRIFNLVK